MQEECRGAVRLGQNGAGHELWHEVLVGDSKPSLPQFPHEMQRTVTFPMQSPGIGVPSLLCSAVLQQLLQIQEWENCPRWWHSYHEPGSSAVPSFRAALHCDPSCSTAAPSACWAEPGLHHLYEQPLSELASLAFCGFFVLAQPLSSFKNCLCIRMMKVKWKCRQINYKISFEKS